MEADLHLVLKKLRLQFFLSVGLLLCLGLLAYLFPLQSFLLSQELSLPFQSFCILLFLIGVPFSLRWFHHKTRAIRLEKALKERQLDSIAVNSIRKMPQKDYQLFKARVIKNSLNLADNYITLDKGSSSGIHSEMGVVDGNGIVGIVYETSPSYSVVISVLNSKSNISCKIVGSDYFGYLKWEHGDSRYAYLKDLPRHAEFNLGDTVVTSGFSTVFPEGIMVGTVDDMSDSHDGLSYLLKIKLATDFGKLSDVRVIARNGQQEQKELENKTTKQ